MRCKLTLKSSTSTFEVLSKDCTIDDLWRSRQIMFVHCTRIQMKWMRHFCYLNASIHATKPQNQVFAHKWMRKVSEMWKRRVCVWQDPAWNCVIRTCWNSTNLAFLSRPPQIAHQFDSKYRSWNVSASRWTVSITSH